MSSSSSSGWIGYFNSIKVRLERLNPYLANIQPHFNSIKVRLEHMIFYYIFLHYRISIP